MSANESVYLQIAVSVNGVTETISSSVTPIVVIPEILYCVCYYKLCQIQKALRILINLMYQRELQ